MIVDNTRKILAQNEMFAKKQYGQNFLVNKQVLEKIISLSNLNKETAVIEVGPGLGALTEFLAINAGKVLCYEIDANMISILKSTLINYNNVEIIQQDILDANILDDIKEHLTDFDRVVVVANLPYYITTPIIMKFLQETNISEFTLMVQKEVGQRLSGKPRTKEYNALSVLMNYMGEATIDYKVPKNSFLPEPKVESVVLRINKKKNDYALINESNFFSFIRHMFSQRRKTLLNNLLGKTPLNKDEIVDLLMALNLNPSVRAEELDLDSIIKLYKVIYEN